MNLPEYVIIEKKEVTPEIIVKASDGVRRRLNKNLKMLIKPSLPESQI
jgi:hypothetical protein